MRDGVGEAEGDGLPVREADGDGLVLSRVAGVRLALGAVEALAVGATEVPRPGAVGGDGATPTAGTGWVAGRPLIGVLPSGAAGSGIVAASRGLRSSG